MDEYSLERHLMVEEQIANRGLNDPRLLTAFESVPRHLFVPEESRYAAYEDHPLPIGFDQTISQPYMVALMTSLLDLTGIERVLEVGTGSGYQAAILGLLAGEVHTIEFVPELATRAEKILKHLGYEKVKVHLGDGSLGCPESSPFEAILVTAAAPKVPPPILDQLTNNGRLVIPVSDHWRTQLLKLLIRHDTEISEHVITSVNFVPLKGRYGSRTRKRTHHSEW
jgi:protein-L-isoaspartate(D-aspartate) O-methyltransferase